MLCFQRFQQPYAVSKQHNLGLARLWDGEKHRSLNFQEVSDLSLSYPSAKSSEIHMHKAALPSFPIMINLSGKGERDALTRFQMFEVSAIYSTTGS